MGNDKRRREGRGGIRKSSGGTKGGEGKGRQGRNGGRRTEKEQEEEEGWKLVR